MSYCSRSSNSNGCCVGDKIAIMLILVVVVLLINCTTTTTTTTIIIIIITTTTTLIARASCNLCVPRVLQVFDQLPRTEEGTLPWLDIDFQIWG